MSRRRLRPRLRLRGVPLPVGRRGDASYRSGAADTAQGGEHKQARHNSTPSHATRT
jgi:hypothetical protein